LEAIALDAPLGFVLVLRRRHPADSPTRRSPAPRPPDLFHDAAGASTTHSPLPYSGHAQPATAGEGARDVAAHAQAPPPRPRGPNAHGHAHLSQAKATPSGQTDPRPPRGAPRPDRGLQPHAGKRPRPQAHTETNALLNRRLRMRLGQPAMEHSISRSQRAPSPNRARAESCQRLEPIAPC
jgi:hypothetical protein